MLLQQGPMSSRLIEICFICDCFLLKTIQKIYIKIEKRPTTANSIVVIAITRRHLSSDNKVFKYLLIVRHISDSRVFSLHDLIFSLRYFRRFELLANNDVSLSLSSEDVGEADDAV